MSSFTTPLKVSPLDNGRDWELCEGFDYHVGDENSTDIIHVPKGFVTDFASTHTLQWLSVILTVAYGALTLFTRVTAWVGVAFMVIVLAGILITPYGKPCKSAVLHDWLYFCQDRTRKEADAIFKEAMCITSTAPWQCFLMYWAVRCFGFLAWKTHR